MRSSTFHGVPTEKDFRKPECGNPPCMEKFDAYKKIRRTRLCSISVTIALFVMSVPCIWFVAMFYGHIVEDKCPIVRETHRLVRNCTRCVQNGPVQLCTRDKPCIHWESIRVNHPSADESCEEDIGDQILPEDIRLNELRVTCYFATTRWEGMALQDGRCASTDRSKARLPGSGFRFWGFLVSFLFAVPLVSAGLLRLSHCVFCGHASDSKRTSRPYEKFCTCAVPPPAPHNTPPPPPNAPPPFPCASIYYTQRTFPKHDSV